MKNSRTILTVTYYNGEIHTYAIRKFALAWKLAKDDISSTIVATVDVTFVADINKWQAHTIRLQGKYTGGVKPPAVM